MSDSVAAWDEDIAPDRRIRLEYIDHFNARGMKCVFGRADWFGNKAAFNLELWKTKDGRLLARLYSRSSEVDNESLEVLGYQFADCPELDDRWVPDVLRRYYDRWITANF